MLLYLQLILWLVDDLVCAKWTNLCIKCCFKYAAKAVNLCIDVM